MRISDWSSDVCSSDLQRIVAHEDALDDEAPEAGPAEHRLDHHVAAEQRSCLDGGYRHGGDERVLQGMLHKDAAAAEALGLGEGDVEIGRASCRARVCQYV